VASNDCITDTTRYSVRRAGLLFCSEFELNGNRANGLFARADKCEFHVTSCKYLRYMLSPEGLTMAPYKVQIIQDWPDPWKVKDIQSFLGFANFYRRFIFRILWNHRSAYTSYPQGYPLHFTNECCSAFEALKKAFTTAPVLTHWIPDTQITVETDASDYALAAVLSITTSNGELHSHCVPLPDLFRSGPQLWRPRQRAPHDFWSLQTMATLLGRLWTPDRHGHRSPELAILFNDQNPHTSASTMVWIPLRIQLHHSFPSQKTWNQTQCTH